MQLLLQQEEATVTTKQFEIHSDQNFRKTKFFQVSDTVHFRMGDSVSEFVQQHEVTMHETEISVFQGMQVSWTTVFTAIICFILKDDAKN